MKRHFTILIVGLIAGFAGSAIFRMTFPEQAAANTHEIQNESYQQVPSQKVASRSLFDEKQDFTVAAEMSTNSVVYIRTVGESRGSVSWYDWFFGGGGGQQVISSGSGVIYTEDGFVITNNHVIENAEEIEVIVGKRPYPATVIGTDPSADLAVLKIEGDKLPAVRMGKSREVKVGDWVLAVGNPFNLTSTVTAGIVSAKGRDLNILKENFPLESFIQTDAAINPGNSGGALVNLEGELIGINTAIYSRTGSYSGYGFAVPVDVVKKIADDLIRYGKVQKSFIEAEVTDLDYELAQTLNTDNPEGVVITYTREGGKADKAGLEKGDIIRKIDGTPIVTKSNYEEAISYHSPGESVHLTLERGSKTLEKDVMLVNEEGTTDIIKNRAVHSNSLGADFETISRAEKELFNIKNGVRIDNIKNGIVSRIGIESGFILQSINGEKVTEAEDAIGQIESLRGRVILEGVNRKGVNRYYSYYY